MGDDSLYKTLGIIGGMGPLATVKLFEKIVLKTKADCDQEHVHILIDNNINIADRTSFILDPKSEDPKVELIISAKKLEKAGADFLAMPCNTAHDFYQDIKREVDIPFLNMIELTKEYIQRECPNMKKVGLLSTEGTIKARVYDKVFENSGIDILKPSKESQKYISALINHIKEDVHEDNLDGFYQAMEEMRQEGAELFITGCTEISVALDLYKLKGKFADPMDIMTRAIIEFSGKKIKV